MYLSCISKLHGQITSAISRSYVAHQFLIAHLALCCTCHLCNERSYISCCGWRERFSASPRVNQRLLCTFQSKLFAASTAVEKSQCEVMNFVKTAWLRLLKRVRVGNKSRKVARHASNKSRRRAARFSLPAIRKVESRKKPSLSPCALPRPLYSINSNGTDAILFSFRWPHSRNPAFSDFLANVSLLENNFPARESYITDIVPAMNSFGATILIPHSWCIFGKFWEIPGLQYRPYMLWVCVMNFINKWKLRAWMSTDDLYCENYIIAIQWFLILIYSFKCRKYIISLDL